MLETYHPWTTHDDELKKNPYHDERGRFTFAPHAVAPMGSRQHPWRSADNPDERHAQVARNATRLYQQERERLVADGNMSRRIAEGIEVHYSWEGAEGQTASAGRGERGDMLVIHLGDPLWRDPAAAEARLREQPEARSYTDAGGVLRHELTHILHNYSAAGATPAQARAMTEGWGSDRFGALGRAVSGATQRRTARQVSEYATLNPAEFVAEVFAAATGPDPPTYPERVWRMYDAYFGPPVRSRR